MGIGDLPGLRTALLSFLSRNFEVDARLARNAVLSRMPLPALDLAHPVPRKDPILEAYTLCTLREGDVPPWQS